MLVRGSDASISLSREAAKPQLNKKKKFAAVARSGQCSE
jgi:hypothetical protein